MADFKPRSKVVLEELLADEIGPTLITIVEKQRKENTIMIKHYRHHNVVGGK